MHTFVRIVLAFGALIAATSTSPAGAADLYGGPVEVPPGLGAPALAVAGPCYVRGDVGRSWTVDSGSRFVGNADPAMSAQQMEESWFAETGFGCGSGSRGFRADLTLGLRDNRAFEGDYLSFPGPTDGHLTTGIMSFTAMVNGYYDLGNMNGFVPYVGVGLGAAFHSMDDVANDVGPDIRGNDNVSFAWSVMAGFGYQLTERAILDVGYRYVDLGSVRSSARDTTGAASPRLEVNDMTAHEFKLGLRYHLGYAR